jgi:aminoglycoside phosphotransferase (APT) family kinase protein
MEMEFSEKLLLQLAELLGRLHSIPLSTFTNFIEKFEEPGALGLTIEERYRRNIHSWRQYVEKVEHLPSPYLTFLFHWLEQNIPSDTRSSVSLSRHSIIYLTHDATGPHTW